MIEQQSDLADRVLAKIRERIDAANAESLRLDGERVGTTRNWKWEAEQLVLQRDRAQLRLHSQPFLECSGCGEERPCSTLAVLALKYRVQ